MSVRTKAESMALWQTGVFGPKLASWGSLAELEVSGYEGKVAIREARPGSPHFTHGLRREEVGGRVAALLARGDVLAPLHFSACANDEQLTLQGEVMRSPAHLTLFFTEDQQPMRHALRAHGQQVEGLRAWVLLRQHLTPSSLADLEAIWDRYPDGIIEFSCYRDTLPGYPGRNTLIWEVREGY